MSPAYAFEMNREGAVLYDDDVVLEEGWDALAAAGWRVARTMPTRTERQNAMQRIGESKKKARERPPMT